MEIKIHSNLINVIRQTLELIFNQNKLADKEIPKALKNKQFGSKDRAFLAETMYDIVRWKLKYEFIAQQIFGDKIQYSNLVLISLLNRGFTVKNLEVLNINIEVIEKILTELQKEIADKSIEQSYLSSFYDYSLSILGNSWYELAKSLNKKAEVYIRINSNKISTEEFSTFLEKENISFKKINNLSFLSDEKINAFSILSKNNLVQSEFFKKQLFQFQDIGSQSISHFIHKLVKNKKNLKILDLCSGMGGKTLHLSELFDNKAIIVATEFDERRFQKLKENTKFIKNIQTIPFQEISNQKYDIVFVDAPCSGSGTFRRQPDLKYKMSESYILEKVTIQQELLEKSKALISKNGLILYATCSILPIENELQIEQFISKNQTYNVLEQHQLLPEKYNSDGFYMCALKQE